MQGPGGRAPTGGRASADGRTFLRVAHEALRVFADGALELLYPTRCVSCDLPGELVCDDCRAELPWIEQRWACPCCGAPFGWLTCTECGGDWETRATVAALSFRGTPARMVTCYKDEHELRLAPVIAAAMATALDEASAWPAPDGAARIDPAQTDLLCFVPATAKAYARRGFDHMELVAHRLSHEVGVPFADVLARHPARDQRELGKEERQTNLAGTVEVLGDVAGLGILLVDDVITTGSSIRACARALLDRGAREVSACALARVW
ncbi:MAG: ComF family protein [Olsenella sp.]|nr:ComF family protein [Olsenella sp.]